MDNVSDAPNNRATELLEILLTDVIMTLAPVGELPPVLDILLEHLLGTERFSASMPYQV